MVDRFDGPWKVVGGGQAKSRAIRTLADDPIAIVSFGLNSPDYENVQKLEAIARVIAAAPELIALVDRVSRLNPDAGEIGAGMLTQLVHEARAAITKAEGRS